MNLYERIWRKANRVWRKYVTIPVKQLLCRHTERAYRQRAFEYDANPPRQRYRWAIMQREVCLQCGKPLGKSRIIRDGMSRKEVGNIMRKLQRQQKQDFK